MKIPLLMTVLLGACGPLPRCITRAGLELQPSAPAGWTCEKLQHAEDATLKAVAGISTFDPRFPDAAKALAGWRVHVLPTTSWVDEQGIEVAGLTYCGTATICVGNPDPIHGALAHELIHVIQKCVASTTSKDPHADWAPVIYDAIESVK